MRPLIVMTILFLLFVAARFYVFDVDAPKPTEKTYDKPVLLRLLEIPKASIPQGFTLTNGRADGSLPPAMSREAAMAAVSRFDRADLPDPAGIGECLVAVYTGTLGERVTVVTAQYKKKDALSKVDASKYVEPRYMILDHQLTWIDCVQDEAIARFHKAFKDNAMVQKKQRRGLEKLVVASNAYLKFFADLLVGAFGFILVLFFTKYFLIIRPTEQ